MRGDADAFRRVVLDRLPSDLDYLWWDDYEYPSRSEIRTSVTASGAASVLRTADGDFDLRGVRAGWLRRPNRPVADPAVTDDTQRSFAEAVARSVDS